MSFISKAQQQALEKALREEEENFDYPTKVLVALRDPHDGNGAIYLLTGAENDNTYIGLVDLGIDLGEEFGGISRTDIEYVFKNGVVHDPYFVGKHIHDLRKLCKLQKCTLQNLKTK